MWVSILIIKKCRVCLKERESCHLVGIIIIESLFYTTPVMSVHTEDKEVQSLLEKRESFHLIGIFIIESLFFIPYQWWVSIRKMKKCKVCLKERESCYLVGIIIIESRFYTIPVMSVHAEDKEVQSLLEKRESYHLIGIVMLKVYFLYHTSDECPNWRWRS